MKILLNLFISLFWLPAAFSNIDESKYSIFTGQVGRINLMEKTQFENFQYDLMYLVVALKKNSEDNHFCLLGYEWPENKMKAMVYWKEGSRIFLWSGRDTVPEDYSDYANSLISSPSIDLKKDVVERQDPMAMSTYLRRDVEGTLEDCAKHGVQYELGSFTPPPPKGADDW